MRKQIFTIIFTLVGFLNATAGNDPAAAALLNRVGGDGAADRFILTIDQRIADPDTETFVIDSAKKKPRITGSTLSALTTGLGWYLNHYANINISWNSPTADIVNAKLPLPKKAERHSTDTKYRHYLNYCTFSYSMSTWSWDRWQQEIDWMALHGVNMPLQIVGMEEVWRRTLASVGYTKDEINDFIAGPAYQAWFLMGNVQGIGGPNPDWWYERQATLGKQITGRMRELGMEPVLPGIYFVPSTISEKTGMRTYSTGIWQHCLRPYVPDITDERFSALAAEFYKNLDDVLGKTTYYSMDPFHESYEALPSNINPDETYQGLYKALTASHPDAKWVIQGWEWNKAQWRSLENIPMGKLIVLDLKADTHPAWDKYGDHDIVFSTVFIYGGCTGIYGRIDAAKDSFDRARQHATVKGIAAIPEAIEQNAVIYDYYFEMPWHDQAPDAGEWVTNYTERRYNTVDEHAKRAWNLLYQSALNCHDNTVGGPQEATVCGRPALEIPHVSSWGNSKIFYNPTITMEAAEELLKADIEHPNYNYDLANVARQALTDYSQGLLAEIKAAHLAGDTVVFNAKKDRFLGLLLDIDDILATVPDFMLGTWTQRARSMADDVAGTTDADRDWLDLDNARKLITTWHDEEMAIDLRDYAYREWEGMMRNYYYPRWKTWFDAGMQEPDGGWYKWERARICDTPTFSNTPHGNTKEIVERVINKYKQ